MFVTGLRHLRFHGCVEDGTVLKWPVAGGQGGGERGMPPCETTKTFEVSEVEHFGTDWNHRKKWCGSTLLGITG
jgi:hypothetical protein